MANVEPPPEDKGVIRSEIIIINLRDKRIAA